MRFTRRDSGVPDAEKPVMVRLIMRSREPVNIEFRTRSGFNHFTGLVDQSDPELREYRGWGGQRIFLRARDVEVIDA